MAFGESNGFDQSEGRIEINTGTGPCLPINPEHVTGYGFISDDRVREYEIDGEIVKVNRYKQFIKELCAVEI